MASAGSDSRTSSWRARSRSAATKPTSSGARASTSPHGSTICDPPKLSLSGGWVPIWSAATTNAWFSIARARTRVSQWAAPVTFVKAAGMVMIRAPRSARIRYSSGKRRS